MTPFIISVLGSKKAKHDWTTDSCRWDIGDLQGHIVINERW